MIFLLGKMPKKSTDIFYDFAFALLCLLTHKGTEVSIRVCTIEVVLPV